MRLAWRKNGVYVTMYSDQSSPQIELAHKERDQQFRGLPSALSFAGKKTGGSVSSMTLSWSCDQK